MSMMSKVLAQFLADFEDYFRDKFGLILADFETNFGSI
jgi:hypothetical protein